MPRASIYTVGSILIPIICLIFSVGIVTYEYRRAESAHEELRKVEDDTAFYQSLVTEMKNKPLPSKVPVIMVTENEPIDFVNTLQLLCRASHTQIVSLYNAAPLAPAPVVGATTQAKLPDNVQAIASAITLQGTYKALRSFFYMVLRHPRLFTITNVKEQSTGHYPLLNATFTLTRYIQPAK